MDRCEKCFNNGVIEGVVILPLLNDPVVPLCRECLNEYKIIINQSEFENSVWNKKYEDT